MDDKSLSELEAHLKMSAGITHASQVRNHVTTARLTRTEDCMPRFLTLEEALECVGKQVGVTEWLEITQKQVDQFAEATGDFQFIHIDPVRARRETRYGGTVAHGFLTLSLLSVMASQAGTIKIKGTNVVLNYGLDNVRFLSPVRVGKRIRGRFELMSVVEKRPGDFLLKHRVTMDIEGEDKPAMIAEWLGMGVS